MDKMLNTDYLDAGQKVLRETIINATNNLEQDIFGVSASIKIQSNTIKEILSTQYDSLLEAINQQSTLLYIILGLLGLVTALVIVSILNQRKLKKELREIKDLLNQTKTEDKPQ